MLFACSSYKSIEKSYYENGNIYYEGKFFQGDCQGEGKLYRENG